MLGHLCCASCSRPIHSSRTFVVTNGCTQIAACRSSVRSVASPSVLSRLSQSTSDSAILRHQVEAASIKHRSITLPCLQTPPPPWPIFHIHTISPGTVPILFLCTPDLQRDSPFIRLLSSLLTLQSFITLHLIHPSHFLAIHYSSPLDITTNSWMMII